MGQHSRVWVVKVVHARALVLFFAFASLLTYSPSTQALPLEPVLDRVTSLTNLSDSNDFAPENNRRGFIASENSPRSSKSNASPNNASTATYQPAPSTPIVVVEPLQPLPSIDAPEIRRKVVSMPRSVAVTPVIATASLPSDSFTPLQATNHGWQIFGLAWYWWVLMGTGGFYALRWLANIRRQRLTVEQMI